jgi:predicted NBD/HSP70 family sugar kinase
VSALSTNEETRRRNLAAVLGHLHSGAPLSRSEITQRTGLNRSTVATLVGELEQRGIVAEGAARAAGGPGRPSPLVFLSETGPTVLAVSILVDSIVAATFGLGGRVQQQARIDRLRGRMSFEETIVAVRRLALPLLRELAPGQTLVGVGVAIAGLVRHEDGFVHTAPNLGWRDHPLAAGLRDALDREVPVWAGNDADLGALAEHRRGSADVADLVFLYGEVGVGAGVIAGGQPLRGASGYAGEVGHVAVNPEGVRCRCGSTGCLETEIGAQAILRRAGFPEDAGPDAVDRVFQAAAQGDPQAREALDEVGAWLGVGVAALVNIFNPSRVVFGGLLAFLYAEAGERVEAELDARALNRARDETTLAASALGPMGPLTGAAELAFDATLRDPTTIQSTRHRESA